jgi:hypothetical protein
MFKLVSLGLGVLLLLWVVGRGRISCRNAIGHAFPRGAFPCPPVPCITTRFTPHHPAGAQCLTVLPVLGFSLLCFALLCLIAFLPFPLLLNALLGDGPSEVLLHLWGVGTGTGEDKTGTIIPANFDGPGQPEGQS